MSESTHRAESGNTRPLPLSVYALQLIFDVQILLIGALNLRQHTNRDLKENEGNEKRHVQHEEAVAILDNFDIDDFSFTPVLLLFQTMIS
jgi:hypothetical protein